MQIRRIVLQTNDTGSLYSFYKELLDFSVSRHSDHAIAILAGKSELIFEQNKMPGNPFYHFAFNIPSNQIDAAHDWLIGRVDLLWLDEYKSDIADFASWHAKSVYFIDPAGNIVELIARFDLDDVCSGPFSVDQLRSVSEIGLVFENEKYDEQVEALMKNFNLPYFEKQSPMERFRAIGDDEGLFIAVGNSRNWYPTKKKSDLFPVQVDFIQAGKEFQLRW